MRQETVVWAYSDMDAARRLWPRVRRIIEEQVEHGELELSLADQRRVIAAVVNDLLEQEKAGNTGFSSTKAIEKLLRPFRRRDTRVPQQQTA